MDLQPKGRDSVKSGGVGEGGKAVRVFNWDDAGQPEQAVESSMAKTQLASNFRVIDGPGATCFSGRKRQMGKRKNTFIRYITAPTRAIIR